MKVDVMIEKVRTTRLTLDDDAVLMLRAALIFSINYADFDLVRVGKDGRHPFCQADLAELRDALPWDPATVYRNAEFYLIPRSLVEQVVQEFESPDKRG